MCLFPQYAPRPYPFALVFANGSFNLETLRATIVNMTTLATVVFEFYDDQHASVLGFDK